jgi:GNAT superfamily N-acetyltransferase
MAVPGAGGTGTGVRHVRTRAGRVVRVVRTLGQVDAETHRSTREIADLEIRAVAYTDPDAGALVADLMADLAERYGSGDETPVDPADFAPPRGAFLVAYRAGEPVACGGWRSRPDMPGAAEIKRMYAAPAARGTGVAAAVLRAIEESARRAGLRRAVLETGDEQPEALRFYARNGYALRPNFGYYRDEPGARSFTRDL